MIWGAFSSHGKCELAVVPTKMNSEDYIRILESHLEPYLQQYDHLELTFQQDNASVHSSKVTKTYLQRSGINVMNWPAVSPDLNPIENVWGILVREIYDDGKQYNTVDELEVAIRNSWRTISTQTLQNLSQSMPNRIFQVINRNGGATDY